MKKEVKEMLEMSTFEILDLEAEPDNRYDSDAVKVMWEGYFIGYIPRDHSYNVSAALDDGFNVGCILRQYYTTGPLDERAQIEIRIDQIFDSFC